MNRRPPSRWLVLVEASVALAVAAAMIALLPFRRIVALVRDTVNHQSAMTVADAAQVERIRWAVTAAARRLPWRTKCFEQGLAAHWLLRRRGIASELHYGVAPSGTAGLQAHVWLTAGGRDVVGGDIAADFVEMDCFATRS